LGLAVSFEDGPDGFLGLPVDASLAEEADNQAAVVAVVA